MLLLLLVMLLLPPRCKSPRRYIDCIALSILLALGFSQFRIPASDPAQRNAASRRGSRIIKLLSLVVPLEKSQSREMVGNGPRGVANDVMKMVGVSVSCEFVPELSHLALEVVFAKDY